MAGALESAQQCSAVYRSGPDHPTGLASRWAGAGECIRHGHRDHVGGSAEHLPGVPAIGRLIGPTTRWRWSRIGHQQGVRGDARGPDMGGEQGCSRPRQHLLLHPALGTRGKWKSYADGQPTLAASTSWWASADSACRQRGLQCLPYSGARVGWLPGNIFEGDRATAHCVGGVSSLGGSAERRSNGRGPATS